MRFKPWLKFRFYTVRTIPCLTILLAITLEVGVLPGLVMLFPSILLGTLYYWGIYRPDLIPSVFLIVIGCFTDSVLGTPLGCHSLVFLAAYWLVLTQRRHFIDQSFVVVWLGFTVLAIIAELFKWVLLLGMMRQYYEFSPVVLQIMLSSFFYPLPSRSLVKIHRWVPLNNE